jgi:outer membrane protein assembly factor BamD (BamD/ComL family)
MEDEQSLYDRGNELFDAVNYKKAIEYFDRTQQNTDRLACFSFESCYVY